MASAGNLKASLKWGVGSENWEGRGEAQDGGAVKGPPTNGGVSRVKSALLGLIEVCMLQLTVGLQWLLSLCSAWWVQGIQFRAEVSGGEALPRDFGGSDPKRQDLMRMLGERCIPGQEQLVQRPWGQERAGHTQGPQRPVWGEAR